MPRNPLEIQQSLKEGLGAWRHWVFASDEFPDDIWAWPGPKCHGSLPGMALFHGFTVEEVAESVLALCPDVAEAGRGQDENYVAWYREMLAAHAYGILEMESPLRASIGGLEVKVPALKAWTSPPPTPMSSEQLEAAHVAQQLQVMERARQRRVKRRRSP